MEFVDPDKKLPEVQNYAIKYKGCLPKYFGETFYLLPFGDLEKKVLVVISDPNIRRNGRIPDEIKDELSTIVEDLGIGHLELMFPEPNDSFPDD